MNGTNRQRNHGGITLSIDFRDGAMFWRRRINLNLTPAVPAHGQTNRRSRRHLIISHFDSVGFDVPWTQSNPQAASLHDERGDRGAGRLDAGRLIFICE